MVCVLHKNKKDPGWGGVLAHTDRLMSLCVVLVTRMNRIVGLRVTFPLFGLSLLTAFLGALASVEFGVFSSHSSRLSCPDYC